MTTLTGILPVLQTPFADDGAIDHAALRREVDFVVACGAHGIVVPAIASEYRALTDAERRALVETVVARAAGRLPVVAGVSAADPATALALAGHARAVGADAVMALPPDRPESEAVAFYRALAEAAGRPVVLQNAGAALGRSLPTARVRQIVATVPGVRHVKEERTPAGHHMSDLLAGDGAGRPAGVLGGSAGIYLPAELARGATGCMPSAAVADVLVALWDAWQSGDRGRARDLHAAVLPLLTMEMSVMMAISKEVLRRRGVLASTRMRDPEFPALDAGDHAELDALWPRVERLFGV